MIIARIHNGNDTLLIDLPRDFVDLQIKLHSIGINKKPQEIPITNNNGDDIRVILYSQSDIGAHLVRIFKAADNPVEVSLADVNVADYMVTNADEVFKTNLEQNILYGRYDSGRELLEAIKTMTYEAGSITESFYFPLTAKLAGEECEDCIIGTYENEEWCPVDNSVLIAYASDIREAICGEQSRDLKNMAEYFRGNDSVEKKLVSADWTVEKRDGVLYGCVNVRLKAALTSEEKEVLKEWITGQNADGLGEGFEQRPLSVEEGDLYISFWSSEDDYFIYDKDEMDEYVLRRREQQMGGM